MSAKHGEMTINQRRCIKALLEHSRVEDAASSVGVSGRTVYRWLNDPLFVAALRSAETEILSDGIRALIVDLKRNHEVIRAIRDGERSSPNLRLRAAKMLDDSLLRWREIQTIEDLTARVAVLEGKSNDKTKR